MTTKQSSATKDIDFCARRLGLDESELLDAAVADPSWWQELAQYDPGTTTRLAALLAARMHEENQTLALKLRRPHRYVVERQAILSSGDTFQSESRLADLESIWELVPYLNSSKTALSTRCSLLREMGCSEQLVELSDLLAELPEGAMAKDALPRSLWQLGDGEAVPTVEVARRAEALRDEELEILDLAWLPAELARLARATRKTSFLRQLLAMGARGVAVMCAYGRAHRSRHARGPTLLAGMTRLAELIQVIDGSDTGSDPLLGCELALSEVAIDQGSISEFELGLELRYAERLGSLVGVSEKDVLRIAKEVTAGLNPLCDMLEAARVQGARIEGFPSVQLRTSFNRVRTYGHLADGTYPDSEELSRLIALGIDELSSPEDRELLSCFLVAVVTLCRPKESRPCREDLAPLGEQHQMIFIDWQTGKTGSRELYVPASAVKLLGFSPSWFPSRRVVLPHPLEALGLARHKRYRSRWQRVLPEEHTTKARLMLEEASRRIRIRYEKETGRQLSDRLAYLWRKALAAYLIRFPIRPAEALTDVLGHQDLSGDTPYTRLTSEEILAQNTSLIKAARSWGTSDE